MFETVKSTELPHSCSTFDRLNNKTEFLLLTTEFDQLNWQTFQKNNHFHNAKQCKLVIELF